MSGNVRLRNMLSPSTTEGQWVLSMKESGLSVEEIVEAVRNKIGGYGPQGSDTLLVVEYQLGHRPASDIEHLLLPHRPDNIRFIQVASEGYLCRTYDAENASFEVLITAPSLSQEDLIELLDNRSAEIAWVAYKNAHEGHPVGYSLPGDAPQSSRTALAGISYAELKRFMD